MAKVPATPPVDLDLDTYEFERGPGPFKANVRGRVVDFNDPLEQPYNILVDLGQDFYQFLAIALSNDNEEKDDKSNVTKKGDLDYFMGLQYREEGVDYRPLNTREIRLLMERYAAHFGLGTPGNGAGSPT